MLLGWEYFRIRKYLSDTHVQPEGSGSATPVEHVEASREVPARPSLTQMLEPVDPADAGIDDEPAFDDIDEPEISAPRPSEIRAERERRAEIMRRRTGR